MRHFGDALHSQATPDRLGTTVARRHPKLDLFTGTAPGHGADHLLPALVSPSLSIPVLDGRLQLGTWPSVVLVDTNGDNPVRRVRISFLAGESAPPPDRTRRPPPVSGSGRWAGSLPVVPSSETGIGQGPG